MQRIVQKGKGRLQGRRKRFLSCGSCLCCLYLVSGLGCPTGACAKAGAQQLSETGSASAKEEKGFRWTTTGKVYIRYGGVRASRPTNLFGFGPYNPAGGEIDTLSGEAERYTSREEYTELRRRRILNANRFNSTLPKDEPPLEDWDQEKRQLYRSFNAPSLEKGDIRLDLYELLLGFEASSTEKKKWQGKARATLDVFELGARLSNDDWGGRFVEVHDFDSGGVREAFVSLSRKKRGELRLGITEGVARRLDAGASDISAGNGFFGDLSKTPWHIQQLGWELGAAASDNFPKVQYLSSKFYGISVGAEWFSNLRTPENSLKPFSRDSSSLCLPSLFYTADRKLFEPNLSPPPENPFANPFTPLDNTEEKPFTLYDNTEGFLVNAIGDDSESIDSIGNLYLQTDLLPPPVSDARCWQGSVAGASWHEDARPAVMGGNVAVAYEKNFFNKKLSLKFATRYGIRSTEAKAIESDEDLIDIFSQGTQFFDTDDTPLLAINRKANQLEQAVGFSTSLTWRDYSFFGNVTYQLPGSITLENVGGETLSEKGNESILWSVGIKLGQRIPRKKGNDAKNQKKGRLSLSFTQAFTKDPRYNDGKQEMTFLLNLQSLYPFTKNIALVVDYWYGDAAVSVPFFVTAVKLQNQGVLFYERKLVPNHEFVVGIKTTF